MTDFTTKLPRNLYRATQVQALDRIAIEEFGIAGFQLMQVAGAVAFNQLLEGLAPGSTPAYIRRQRQ